jgi:hypothetical protein
LGTDNGGEGVVEVEEEEEEVKMGVDEKDKNEGGCICVISLEEIRRRKEERRSNKKGRISNAGNEREILLDFSFRKLPVSLTIYKNVFLWRIVMFVLLFPYWIYKTDRNYANGKPSKLSFPSKRLPIE